MKRSRTWLVFISLILLVIFRYISEKPSYKNGDKVRITTRVLTDPIKYETSQYLKAEGLKVYLPRFPEISYGDRIILEGIVEDGKLKDPELQSLDNSKNFLFNLRGKIISFYQSTLPEPFPGLIAGVTLGSKGSLTSGFWEDVKAVGLTHVVVASGMNVTFVSSFLLGAMSLILPRKKAIPFVILGIVLYLFISGFDAPLIRAAIMGSIAFSAQELGRLVTAWRALILSALIMLVVNPNWIFDLGFILSFVATASLLLFERGIRHRLSVVPGFLKESLSTTLAAQIGVAPILFVTFGQFNILSPIVNALVLWTIPYIMILGTVGGVVGLVIPFLGKVVLYFSYPFVWWFSSVVTLFNF